jgi:hypothetical protein
VPTKREVLEQLSFGKRVAEEEVDELASYFVETNQWRQIFSGEKDVVFGDKGGGKSAIYSLIVSRSDELFDRDIVIVAGEKPRGAPAFQDLIVDPPTSQQEFVGLWKLYFLCLIATTFRDLGVTGDAAERLTGPLEDAGLIDTSERTLQALIRGALDYVRALLRWESVEAGVKLDPNTGMPAGLGGKITFREPGAEARAAGLLSMDSLVRAANDAAEAAGLTVWIVLDRLDVAFAESEEVEGNALRALFMVYSDFREYDRLEIKIFLRSDIWGRVTREGLRETSHVEDQVTIRWDSPTLLNLVIRRCLRNEALRDFYAAEEEYVLSSVARQQELFYRIFPDQVEAGTRKSTTLDWMLGRVRDGTGRVAPRELIHLLTSLRDEQLRMLELGAAEPSGEQLFDRSAFKTALPEVSRARLEQTLLPEYPSLRPFVERLERRKTLQSVETLSEIWGVSAEEASRVADQLVEVGFFERRTDGFWIPFLYRDALQLIQGTEGTQEEASEDEDAADDADAAFGAGASSI